MNQNLFIALLTAHLAGDFVLQSDNLCENKIQKGLSGYGLYLHFVIISACVFFACCMEACVADIVDFLPWIGLISAVHLATDGFKSSAERKLRCRYAASAVHCTNTLFLDGSNTSGVPNLKTYYRTSLWLFLIDQLIHLAVIMFVAFQANVRCNWPGITLPFDLSLGYTVLAILICGTFSNCLILSIIRYKLTNHENSKLSTQANIHAGALIGITERLLILIFVILGQYEAIGFIVAAKSIIRYKEADTKATEYVLAGTLLSVGIAVICGILLIRM